MVDAHFTAPSEYSPDQDQQATSSSSELYLADLPEEQGPTDVASPLVTKSRTLNLELPATTLAALRAAARRYPVSLTELTVEVEGRDNSLRQQGTLELIIRRQ